MCHPGLDPAVMCAATTGPRPHQRPSSTTARGAPMPAFARALLQVPATSEAALFLKSACDLGAAVQVRESPDATSGFRGFTLSLVVSQPSTVDSLVAAALQAGAREVKPVRK